MTYIRPDGWWEAKACATGVKNDVTLLIGLLTIAFFVALIVVMARA